MSTNSQYPLRSASPAADPNASPTVRGESGPPQHKRVYQACIPCRRRKVKCDLGSVDNPGDPPCVRCRRESKECFFSATRRKRKLEDGGEGSLDGYELNDDYVVRNGRKMVQSSPGRRSSMSAPARSVAGYADAPLPAPPLTPGGSIGRTQPLRRPDASLETGQGRQSDESNTHMENFEAQEVMRREVYGPHDALDLLYQAATDSPDHKRTNSNQFSLAVAHMSQDRRPSSARNNQYPFQSNYRKPDARTGTDASIDPALSANQTERAQDPGYQEALKAWSRFRFVRAGWFSADEAIEYIDYYYTFLSPLTPISPPTFQNPSTHLTLLVEEPILTITLLTIATRYKKLVGPGGHCRSHAIHEQLWTYLRGMIERCLWGQEAFGGGLQSSGSDSLDKTSSTAPWRGLRKGSLRTLGTVESLMILTEWHPRALHFPPTEATDELMLPSYEASDAFSNDDEDVHRLAGVGGKRIEGWLEPAWRSDRMCWMLLSTAMGLSYELGVFDNIDELIAAGGEMTRPEYEDRSYQERAGRIKKLLLIYVSQLAGRLGWTNMVPENVRLGDPSFTSRKRRKSAEGKTPDTNVSVATSFNYIPDLALDDQIIHLWAGISNAMKVGNEKLFKSRQHTTSIIKNGSYVGLLKEFVPLLANWKKEFLACQLPQYIGHILLIEFEYVRVYINSLSLQAVVERGANAAGNHANFAAAQPGNGGNPGAAVLSPETQNYYDKLPLAKLGGFFKEDQGYVKEVVDGSRNLLSIVVTGLLPNGYLKHAPVRTYFRIISGAMFLLKTFALGASKHDVQVSLDLMDRAVDALRNCVVDDVHLGIRFADLLETLTSRLRTRFINSASKPVSTTEEPRSQTPQEPEGKRQKMDSNWQIREWNAATPSFDPNGQAATPVPPYDASQNANGTPGNSNNYYASTPNFPSNSNGEPNFDPLFDNSNSWGAGNEMWYLPPGAAFYSNLNEQAITQTADGVNVAGMDLLDYMAGGDFYMDGAQF